MNKIEGLITATHTPMDEKGNLKLEVIKSYYNFLKSNGIKGIFLNGSTGEGYHLTTEERKLLLEEWSATVQQDSFKLFVFTGHLSTRDACELTEHAAGFSNVYGISVTAPFYQRPGNIDILIDICEEIAAFAPLKPFYYYHIPVLTNVSIPVSSFLEKAQFKIPNLQGVKYTHNDLEEYLIASALESGKFEMMAGIDEIALASRAFGAKGYIGSTYNFLAPLFYKMFDLFDNGHTSEARALQLKAIEIIRIIASYGYVSACKFIMSENGVENGFVRLPSRQIHDSEKSELMTRLRKVGFESLVYQ
jgi:N-acetylneuraminate lyase